MVNRSSQGKLPSAGPRSQPPSSRSEGRGLAPQRPSSLDAKPWRQWHSAVQPAQSPPLEVAVPKKPQWGRMLYFLILLAILAVAANFAVNKLFWVKADGIISGKQYTVSASDTVSVQEVLVSPSDSVEEGQLLVRLSSPALIQSLAKNEAEIARLQSELSQVSVQNTGNLSQLRAQLASLQAEKDYLESQYFQETQQLEALRELVEAGASQRGNLDALQSQHNKTWSEYAGVKAALRSTNNQIAAIQKAENSADNPEVSERLLALRALHGSIQEQLDSLDLRAPKTGTVARVPISKGAVLRAGEPAVELVDKNELSAYLYFPPSAEGRLHKGMEIQAAKANGTEVTLVVDKVYPATESLPEQFRDQYQRDPAALLVEATPVDAQRSEIDLTSGTPVTVRLPRISFDDQSQGPSADQEGGLTP